jgi:predicted RNA-binding protein with PUA-like domain
MAYWLFKCDPSKYRIDKCLTDKEPRISWLVTRYRNKIAPSDLAFILRTGRDGGIVAVMRIDEESAEKSELDRELPYCIDQRFKSSQCRVVGELVQRVPSCIHRDTLRGDSGLEGFSPGYQGMNFRISEEHEKRLMELVHKRRS